MQRPAAGVILIELLVSDACFNARASHQHLQHGMYAANNTIWCARACCKDPFAALP